MRTSNARSPLKDAVRPRVEATFQFIKTNSPDSKQGRRNQRNYRKAMKDNAYVYKVCVSYLDTLVSTDAPNTGSREPVGFIRNQAHLRSHPGGLLQEQQGYWGGVSKLLQPHHSRHHSACPYSCTYFRSNLIFYTNVLLDRVQYRRMEIGRIHPSRI